MKRRLVAGWADAGGSFFDHFFLAGEIAAACGDVERTGDEPTAETTGSAVRCPACDDAIERIANGIARVGGLAS